MFIYQDHFHFDGRTINLSRFILVLIRQLGGQYDPRKLYAVVGGTEEDVVNPGKAGIFWLGDFQEHLSDNKKKGPRWKHLVQQYGNAVLVKAGFAEKAGFLIRSAMRNREKQPRLRVPYGLPTTLNKAGTAAADFYLDALRKAYKSDEGIRELADRTRRGKWTVEELRLTLRNVSAKIEIHRSGIFDRPPSA